MSYEVRSRDLSGISNSGIYAYDSYMRDQDLYYTKEGCSMRGYLLVKMKQVKSGFDVKFRFSTRGIWYWKPEISKRWRWDGFAFAWLCFSLRINPNFTEIPDFIVADHLGELQGNSLKGKKIIQSRFNFKTRII